MLRDKTIGFIGGGNMAEALIKGLLEGGVPAANLVVAEPLDKRRGFLVDNYKVKCCVENGVVVSASNIIFLAVKPQVAEKALKEIGPIDLSDKVFVSIMAGVKTAAIEGALSGKPRVVRVMPNTPALVLAASSAVAPGAFARPDDAALTLGIFELVGKAWPVEEKLMDAVTGLSGSGPAYVLTFMEALADGGVKNGLSRDVALGLAAQTVFGTAKLLLETLEHPAVLRDRVTSPGGTTIAGLHALETGGFRSTLMNAVDAATARSRELGAK
ncbi:MAG TPA: pyrroline-5-carboxylate reductase [Geobacteraceae bacterium]|nr:pyrroline-5-carboxylate reductase [Geobacteraceae bacterium]